jgi:type II secretory pathway pseudopilin PulG
MALLTPSGSGGECPARRPAARPGGWRGRLFARFFGSRRRAAFSLMTLVVAATLLNIAVAAALPAWSHIIQYDKEEEVIFRGLQYAEAIRVFQVRFGRYPTNLKELREAEPRCLRKLWKNPLQEDGRWALVPVGIGAPIAGAPGSLGGPNAPGAGAVNPDGSKPGGPGQGTPQVIWSEKLDEGEKLDFGTPRNNLPIRGVYTPSSLEAIHLFMGKESISEWQFTVELISSMQQGTPDDPGFIRPFPVEAIGKPFPPGVVPPVPQPSSNPAGPGQQGAPGPGSPGFVPNDGSGRDIRQLPPGMEPGPDIQPPSTEPDG